MLRRFEVIRKSTLEIDNKRKMNGIRFLAKINPDKYEAGFDKDGDFCLFELSGGQWKFPLRVARVIMDYGPKK